MLFGRPRFRVIGKRNQLRRAHQVDGHIVFHGAHGDSRSNHLKHQRKNQYRRKQSAGRWNCQRAKHVFENDSGMPPELPEAAYPILRLLRGHLDAHREICGRNIFRHAREQHRQLAEPLQFLAAAAANSQVLADGCAFLHAPFANQRIIQITSQISSYRGALHESPSPAGFARGAVSCDATEIGRPAEEALL